MYDIKKSKVYRILKKFSETSSVINNVRSTFNIKRLDEDIWIYIRNCLDTKHTLKLKELQSVL